MSVVVLSRPNLELRSALQQPNLVKNSDEQRFPRRDFCSYNISEVTKKTVALSSKIAAGYMIFSVLPFPFPNVEQPFDQADILHLSYDFLATWSFYRGSRISVIAIQRPQQRPSCTR